nr:DNA topoisomerase IB [Sphingomicrobium sediminis]
MRHSSDEEPGFTRIRRGKGWSYHDDRGAKVDDPDIIDRLNGLAVPPAYRDVWFCRDEHGHIQATGMDEKGRKQYRYHDDFRALAEAEKFAGLAEFGRRLPRIRRKVDKALRRRKLSKEQVVAAAIRLMDRHHLRVGNRQYASRNKSFGTTTLSNRHVERLKTRIKLNFRAKHGVERDITVTDPSLVRVLGQIEDLPGQHLFQYENGDGRVHAIDSQDVNDFLNKASRSDITAKTFRTWGASAMAMEGLLAARRDSQPVTLKSIVEPVAEMLGNTPAVTRSSYIHPDLIEAVKDRPRAPLDGFTPPSRARKRLDRSETALLAFLEQGDPPPKWQQRLARRFFGR